MDILATLFLSEFCLVHSPGVVVFVSLGAIAASAVPVKINVNTGSGRSPYRPALEMGVWDLGDAREKIKNKRKDKTRKKRDTR